MKKIKLPEKIKKDDVEELSKRSGVDEETVKKILDEERKYFTPMRGRLAHKKQASSDPGGTDNTGPLIQKGKLRK